MTQYFHNANRQMLLQTANRLINDNVPTIAMFTNPNDELFNLPIEKL